MKLRHYEGEKLLGEIDERTEQKIEDKATETVIERRKERFPKLQDLQVLEGIRATLKEFLYSRFLEKIEIAAGNFDSDIAAQEVRSIKRFRELSVGLAKANIPNDHTILEIVTELQEIHLDIAHELMRRQNKPSTDLRH